MDSITNAVNPTIDSGLIKRRNTNPKSGHPSSSCMRECVESSKQKNYLSCEKQLTDHEIKSIPLQDRMVTFSKETLKFLCQATLMFAHPVAPSAAVGFAAGATVAAAVGVAGVGLTFGPLMTAGAGTALGFYWASVAGERATSSVDTGLAKGVSAGVATSICMGTAGAVGLATVSAIGSTVEAVGNYFEKND
ncbi:hypothetical protein [Endozoicomonas sp. YOMI1]|uniref:hypothetical protein n=1 Tax=Endozoicomonas sp. YOMI1 TaxID=2828739 RepID=UPI00214763C1|nr:hypothetical protein [Endozoicomonas sp. YOMI1]